MWVPLWIAATQHGLRAAVFRRPGLAQAEPRRVYGMPGQVPTAYGDGPGPGTTRPGIYGPGLVERSCGLLRPGPDHPEVPRRDRSAAARNRPRAGRAGAQRPDDPWRR